MKRRLSWNFYGLCFVVIVSIIVSSSVLHSLSLVEKMKHLIRNNILEQTEKPYLGVNYVINYTMVDYEKHTNETTKTVLFFTKKWSEKLWGLSADKIDKDSPELKNCPVNNCVMVFDRNYLKEIHEFDALVFHETESCWYDSRDFEPIKTRSPHQLYIVAAQEYFNLSFPKHFD
jgi:Fucosyltransferase, N-terminal